MAILQHLDSPLSIPFKKWKHFKEAFAPDIVYEALRGNASTVHTCIDPFGGSGTTALVCQMLGVAPTTIEVNPYLADLIEAKLHLYDIDRLVRDLAAVLRIADRVDPASRRSLLPNTFVEPGVKDRWVFNKDVADRILSIALASDALELQAHRRLFKVLLGGILVTVSNVIVNGKGRRYRSGWKKNLRTAGDVDVLFTQTSTDAIQELRRFENRASSAYSVIRGDTRKVLRGLGPFDVGVFSPPYPNSFDYTDIYNLELWMLGYLTKTPENRTLRTSTLSSHVQVHRDFVPPPTGSQQLNDALGLLRSNIGQLWNRHIPAMVGAYFTETLEIIKSLKTILNTGGSIYMVVGDSSYAGIPVNVASILTELVRCHGLRVLKCETLRVMRKSAQQGGEIYLGENLLVLGCD